MLLSGKTALEFWLKLRHKFPLAENASLISPNNFNDRKIKNFLFRNPELTPSYEFITDRRRNSTSSLTYHYNKRFNTIPCVQIVEGVLVITPVYLLVNLMKGLAEKFFPSLLVACEFSSSFTRGNEFAFSDGGSSDDLLRCKPLLTKTDFTQIERATKTSRDLKFVKNIANYVIENAYSPAEIALALRLSLDRSHGGFGLPKPLLNSALPLKKPNRAMRARQVRPDLLWPKQKVIFEYDGTNYHSAEEHMQQDSGKRNVLISEGFYVMNVTKDQLFNEQKLEHLAEFLRKACRERKASRNYLSPDQLFAREVLRRVIVDYVVKGRIL